MVVRAAGFSGTDVAVVVTPADGALEVVGGLAAFEFGQCVAVVIQGAAGRAFGDALLVVRVVELAELLALGGFLRCNALPSVGVYVIWRITRRGFALSC